MNKAVKIVLLLGLISLSCWNKQDHDITRPEVPRYTLTGTTVDYITGEPVPNTPVRISSVAQLYDAVFATQQVMSDSAGHYTIDPIYPGSYDISVQSDNCWLYPVGMTMEHQDRQFDVKIPDIMYVSKHPTGKSISSSRTYKHINYSYPSFVIKAQTGTIPTKLMRSNSNVPLGYFFAHVTLLGNKPTLKGSNEVNEKDISFIRHLSVSTDQLYAYLYPDTIQVWDGWQYNLLRQFKTNIYIRDIAFNLLDGTLYACTDSTLYSINTDEGTVTKLADLPVNDIIAMTWLNNNLYLYKRQEELLFKVNLQLKVTNVYALANEAYKSIYEKVYDIGFDSYRKLWITTK